MDTKSRGFTLVELMVTIAILAILVTIAVPSLSTFLVRSQRQQATSDFTGALALARSEAIKRGSFVSLAAISSGVGQLQGGWRIFVDPLNSGIFDSSAGSVTTLIATQDAFTSDQVVIGRRGTSPTIANSREYFMFDGQGRAITNTLASGASGITVSIWRDSAEQAKSALCIGWAGRIRLVKDKADNDAGGCG